jgi:hypothetical protein
MTSCAALFTLRVVVAERILYEVTARLLVAYHLTGEVAGVLIVRLEKRFEFFLLIQDCSLLVSQFTKLLKK